MGESLFDQIKSRENSMSCLRTSGSTRRLTSTLVSSSLENGANSSFVNAIVDTTKPVESLLPDPVETLQGLRNKYNTQLRCLLIYTVKNVLTQKAWT